MYAKMVAVKKLLCVSLAGATLGCGAAPQQQGSSTEYGDSDNLKPSTNIPLHQGSPSPGNQGLPNSTPINSEQPETPNASQQPTTPYNPPSSVQHADAEADIRRMEDD